MIPAWDSIFHSIVLYHGSDVLGNGLGEKSLGPFLLLIFKQQTSMTPIPKVIEAFELLLDYYQNKTQNPEYRIYTSCGLCYCYSCLKDENEDREFLYNEVFLDDGHYKHHLNPGGNLFPDGQIPPRIRFLEEEIPRLEKLLKRGYTHI